MFSPQCWAIQPLTFVVQPTDRQIGSNPIRKWVRLLRATLMSIIGKLLGKEDFKFEEKRDAKAAARRNPKHKKPNGEHRAETKTRWLW